MLRECDTTKIYVYDNSLIWMVAIAAVGFELRNF